MFYFKKSYTTQIIRINYINADSWHKLECFAHVLILCVLNLLFVIGKILDSFMLGSVLFLQRATLGSRKP